MAHADPEVRDSKDRERYLRRAAARAAARVVPDLRPRASRQRQEELRACLARRRKADRLRHREGRRVRTPVRRPGFGEEKTELPRRRPEAPQGPLRQPEAARGAAAIPPSRAARRASPAGSQDGRPRRRGTQPGAPPVRAVRCGGPSRRTGERSARPVRCWKPSASTRTAGTKRRGGDTGFGALNRAAPIATRRARGRRGARSARPAAMRGRITSAGCRSTPRPSPWSCSGPTSRSVSSTTRWRSRPFSPSRSSTGTGSRCWPTARPWRH